MKTVENIHLNRNDHIFLRKWLINLENDYMIVGVIWSEVEKGGNTLA